MAAPLDKQEMADSMSDLKLMFGKSVVAARDLPGGHRLVETDLALKKPGTGIPAARMSQIVGRRLKQNITADTMLAEEHFE